MEKSKWGEGDIKSVASKKVLSKVYYSIISTCAILDKSLCISDSHIS